MFCIRRTRLWILRIPFEQPIYTARILKTLILPMLRERVQSEWNLILIMNNNCLWLKYEIEITIRLKVIMHKYRLQKLVPPINCDKQSTYNPYKMCYPCFILLRPIIENWTGLMDVWVLRMLCLFAVTKYLGWLNKEIANAQRMNVIICTVLWLVFNIV